MLKKNFLLKNYLVLQKLDKLATAIITLNQSAIAVDFFGQKLAGKMNDVVAEQNIQHR